MWTLVNASYGIAMGQRPWITSGTHDLALRRPSTRSEALSTDSRLEAAQARRRELPAHTTHEQWVDFLVTADQRRSWDNTIVCWTLAFWWYLRNAGTTRGRVEVADASLQEAS